MRSLESTTGKRDLVNGSRWSLILHAALLWGGWQWPQDWDPKTWDEVPATASAGLADALERALAQQPEPATLNQLGEAAVFWHEAQAVRFLGFVVAFLRGERETCYAEDTAILRGSECGHIYAAVCAESPDYEDVVHAWECEGRPFEVIEGPVTVQACARCCPPVPASDWP